MLHFPILRTKRLTVQLKELSIGESIALASMPVHLEEASSTAFLRYAVASVKGIEDPAKWTVQERIMATAHYLACVLEDGPDFSLGRGRYSDYLDGSADISLAFNSVEIGDIGGDSWSITHLTGEMAESIERLKGEIPELPDALHWRLGGMAAQLIRKGEVIPDFSDGQYDEWLLGRMRVFAQFPSSDFETLMRAYYEGTGQLHHLFAITFDKSGIVVLPKGGAHSDLPCARFPVRSCLSTMAINLARKYD